MSVFSKWGEIPRSRRRRNKPRMRPGPPGGIEWEEVPDPIQMDPMETEVNEIQQVCPEIEVPSLPDINSPMVAEQMESAMKVGASGFIFRDQATGQTMEFNLPNSGPIKQKPPERYPVFPVTTLPEFNSQEVMGHMETAKKRKCAPGFILRDQNDDTMVFKFPTFPD